MDPANLNGFPAAFFTLLSVTDGRTEMDRVRSFNFEKYKANPHKYGNHMFKVSSLDQDYSS